MSASFSRVCAALMEFPDAQCAITKPGPDVGGIAIHNRLMDFTREHPAARIVTPDDDQYLSPMAHAACMVGNSSSGIIEAPTLRLPVSDVHDRQHGRLRGDNVIQATATDIVGCIRVARADGLLDAVDWTNPYGDGQAAPRIVSVLCTVPLDRRLREKR